MSRCLGLLTAFCLWPLLSPAADRVCDQSDPNVTRSASGSWEASVQHQVCETASGRAAAAVTVFVGKPGSALEGRRVVAIAVPRTREEWPVAVWRDDARLEVWVPNFANVLESTLDAPGVNVTLRYCRDDSEARARVARYQDELAQWMAAVTQWSQLRKSDPQAAGTRPARPQEPKAPSQPCTVADIAAGS